MTDEYQVERDYLLEQGATVLDCGCLELPQGAKGLDGREIVQPRHLSYSMGRMCLCPYMILLAKVES